MFAFVVDDEQLDGNELPYEVLQELIDDILAGNGCEKARNTRMLAKALLQGEGKGDPRVTYNLWAKADTVVGSNVDGKLKQALNDLVEEATSGNNDNYTDTSSALMGFLQAMAIMRYPFDIVNADGIIEWKAIEAGAIRLARELDAYGQLG